MEVDHRPDLRLAAGLVVVVLAAVVGPAVWALTVADRLPPEVARHWGTGGQVTGTWPLSSQLLVLGAVTLLVAGVCGTVATVSRLPLAVRRMLAGTATWVAVLLGASQVGALAGQLDLAAASAAPVPDVGLAVGAVLGLLLGIAVAALAREPDHRIAAAGAPSAELPRLPDAEATPSTWRGAPGTSRGLVVVGVVVLLGSAVPLLAGTWWPLVLGACVLVPLVAMVRFRVTVAEDGLVARSGPLTLLRVPLDQVDGAEVIDHLDPFWEFGGWGLRVDVHGRTGLVSRAGEALAVTRADGSQVVVTVEDAWGAAATLNTLADRRAATS